MVSSRQCIRERGSCGLVELSDLKLQDLLLHLLQHGFAAFAIGKGPLIELSHLFHFEILRLQLSQGQLQRCKRLAVSEFGDFCRPGER